MLARKHVPDYVFETSWEVCNKVGGIYTVISTKAPTFVEAYGENYILIGPDVWKDKYNQDFIEDKNLFRSWRRQAEEDGLNLRVGRWNITGSPIVILVDFTPFFSKKNEIFGKFWEDYKLDSLSGEWDYMEPAIFGYAAGLIIEHFYNYTVMPGEKVIAHFHEWMTGTGILYLKKHCSKVLTAFTTHATILGRSIAGNGMPLYNNLHTYNGESLAGKFGITAKFSLEKLSAVEADVFTTVSEITNKECAQFFNKPVDIVTPNGFDDYFVPFNETFDAKRETARKKLIAVTQGITNQKITDDALFIINSGRYEFRNKGIDIFIDSLAKINKSADLKRPVVAFLTIPGDSREARQEVVSRMKNPDFNAPVTDDYCSHYLNHPDSDPIIRRLRSAGLRNMPEDKVKIIFVPRYLDGNDGVINLSYYDLLIGFDLSVFPSYYEPWGYTPLESIAFKIPTITTSLAGFGMWIKQSYATAQPGVVVIERNDSNDSEVVLNIADRLLKLSSQSKEDMLKLRANAHEISRIALWKNLALHYAAAYEIAIEKKTLQGQDFFEKQMPLQLSVVNEQIKTAPEWKKVLIKTQMPKKLENLQKLAMNLWWCWDTEAIQLFNSLKPDSPERKTFNPLEIIASLSSKKLLELENNQEFITTLNKIYNRFEAYMNEPKEKEQPKVAYFSMEFGLHESVKIYSGGLGILAGDYLKAASDNNTDMIGIGLLYRYGYFQQQISINGEQIEGITPQKFTELPLQPVRNANDEWQMVKISFPGRILYAKIWRLDVGRVPLYLLDTDIPENADIDKSVTAQLYGGDWENRLKQELLLGVGGIRMLYRLGIKPDIYHCNEGHAAFIGVERLRMFVENEGTPLSVAKELVRSSSLFTTHTPVPAGHDTFSEDLIRTYISHYPKRLEMTWEEFMGLGRKNINDHNEKFSMSILAARLSQEMNGVSKIHGRVSREMFVDMYQGYFTNELFIGYVTNGVHYKTWANKRWQHLYEKYFGPNFLKNVSDQECWQNIYNVDNREIKEIRDTLRKNLIEFAKKRLYEDMARREENPNLILESISKLNENALTIGFARRFATYKRAHLLFKNLDRLNKIVNNPNRPVQFIFAGKAHPADKAGQDLIKNILEVSRRPEFAGKIVFLENYDTHIARKLVQGVDVWLNTPTRPLEASGTSGEKAIMNGVLNLSVLDGWWAEGYVQDAGWALKEEDTYTNAHFQDQLDAETIYNIIENEIVPAFYDADTEGVSDKWIGFIKNCIAKISPRFTMKRQLDDYINKYYLKLFERFKQLNSNNATLAKQLADWKSKVAKHWDEIEVIQVKYPDSSTRAMMLGEMFETEIMLDLKSLSAEEVGVEVLFARKVNDKVENISIVLPLNIVNVNGSVVTYHNEIRATLSGVFDFTYRIYPKNDLLPHRQDFGLIKWA